MAKQAPRYRFYPTEEELVCFYLRNKLDGRRGDIERMIPVANVCTVDPWQLPEAQRGEVIGDGEPWFYFCPQQEREARGDRPSRTTPSGYWKAAGTPGLVYAADGRPIGTKKTMVFYRGRAPVGAKTKWKLNEYKALEVEEEDDQYAAAHAGVSAPSLDLQTRNEFTLCRLYTKSGGGSENPAAAAASANREETGRKRKKAAPSNTSSSDGDGATQQRLRQKGIDDMADQYWWLS